MYAAALAELGFAGPGEGEFEGDEYVLFGRDSSDEAQELHNHQGEGQGHYRDDQERQKQPQPPRLAQARVVGLVRGHPVWQEAPGGCPRHSRRRRFNRRR